MLSLSCETSLKFASAVTHSLVLSSPLLSVGGDGKSIPWANMPFESLSWLPGHLLFSRLASARRRNTMAQGLASRSRSLASDPFFKVLDSATVVSHVKTYPVPKSPITEKRMPSKVHRIPLCYQCIEGG